MYDNSHSEHPGSSPTEKQTAFPGERRATETLVNAPAPPAKLQLSESKLLSPRLLPLVLKAWGWQSWGLKPQRFRETDAREATR